MGRTYEMAIALSGKVDGSLNSSLLSAAGALAGLENKLKTLSTAQQKVGKYKALQENMRANNVEFQSAKAEAEKLSDWMSKLDKPSSKMQKQFQAAQSKSEKLREKLFGQRKELDALGREMNKAGVSTRNLGAFEDELAAKTAKAARAQSALQKAQAATTAARDRLKFSNIQSELMESGAIFLALKKPIQAAAEFETTMAEIKKVVDFDSPEAFKAMGADLQKLSMRIPMTTKALGEIYAAGGQSGVAKEELLEFTETAAKMGVAFDVEAQQAGEWMAKWRTAFKMNQTEVTALADQINYLGNNTAASASQISDVVSRIGPLGAIGNVAAKQIAALGASIVGAGQSEEVAATGAKNFMLALTAGASATKKQRKALSDLNIEPELLAKEMMKDPEKVMTTLLERISKVDKSQQAALLTQIFGKESVGAISPLLSNLDNLKRNLSLVSGEGFAGSMEKEFAALADTAKNSFQLMQNAAAVFSQNIGDALLPTVKEASKTLVNISSAVLSFSQAHPEAFSTFVKAIAAFGALRVAKTTVSILGTMVKLPFLEAKTGIMAMRAAYVAADGSILTMIKGTKAWTAVQWLLNAAMGANPIGLVIIAVVALATAFVVAYKKCEWFRNKVNSALSALKVVFMSVMETVRGIVDRIIASWSVLKPYFDTFWKWVKFAFFLHVGVIKAVWGVVFSIVKSVFSAIISGAKAFIGALCAIWSPISEFFSKSWEGIKAIGMAIWNPIADSVKSFVDSIYSFFEPLFGRIMAGFVKIGALWTKFKSWFSDTAAGDIVVTAAQQSGMIAAHAAGGIFNRPHLGIVAEDETESIIPHNASGEKIWRATGEQAGFATGSTGGGITFNLTVNAGEGSDGNAIGRQMLGIIEQEFPRLLRRYDDQRARLAY